jgi:hypothetical protein
LLDLVLSDDEGDAGHLLLGIGDGTFASPSSIPFGEPTRAVALADMDGDGAVDVIGLWKSGVSVAFNRANGTLPDPPAVYASAITPRDLVATDFDGDGAPDIAMSGDGGVEVLLNVCEGEP